MRQHDRSNNRSFAHLMQVCFLAGATVLNAGQVSAQSAFDCRDLETHAALPAVEGHDGTFFAIRPELQAHHGLGDATIGLIGELSAALKTRGTTLVLLPVPTRAQVLSDQLPPMAFDLGYDDAASLAVHIDMIARLKSAGITVTDPLLDLRAAAVNGDRPYFQTDPRPTTTGMRILAKTVGAALAQHPDLAGVNRGTFSTTGGAQTTLSSVMRLRLQSACQSDLPAVTTQVFTTSKDANGEINNGTIVLLGTDTTATTDLNLEGFISEETGLYVLGYGVPDGGAFAAMSSYLTSADFQVAPPRVIVWEVPVAASLASNGDQPLRELGAAARNKCDLTIPVTPTPAGNRLRADLGQISLGSETTLLLDGDGGDLPFVRFHFTDTDGLTRTRSIYRSPNQLLTGRFYLPLGGLDLSRLGAIEIEGGPSFGLQSRLAICS